MLVSFLKNVHWLMFDYNSSITAQGTKHRGKILNESGIRCFAVEDFLEMISNSLKVKVIWFLVWRSTGK